MYRSLRKCGSDFLLLFLKLILFSRSRVSETGLYAVAVFLTKGWPLSTVWTDATRRIRPRQFTAIETRSVITSTYRPSAVRYSHSVVDDICASLTLLLINCWWIRWIGAARSTNCKTIIRGFSLVKPLSNTAIPLEKELIPAYRHINTYSLTLPAYLVCFQTPIVEQYTYISGC